MLNQDAAKSLHDYLETIMNNWSQLPEETLFQKLLKEAVMEEFYDVPVSVSVGRMTVNFSNNAAVYNALISCMQEIIEQS